MKSKNDLNKITLAGMFLALSSLLIIIQIPIFVFLKLDFSLAPILIAEAFIPFSYVLIIGLLSPLMILIVYGDPIGTLFLIVLNIIVIIINHFTYSRKNLTGIFLSSFFIIIITSIIVSVLNILIFVPLFYGTDYIETFMTLWFYWIIVLSFNLIKLTIVYAFVGLYFHYFANNQNWLNN